jgi:hypothetical protein
MTHFLKKFVYNARVELGIVKIAQNLIIMTGHSSYGLSMEENIARNVKMKIPDVAARGFYTLGTAIRSIVI